MSRSLTRLIRLVTITPLVLLMLVRVVAAAEPKTIVVLHSYGQNFKPWSEYSKALRQELERRSSWPLIIDDFSVTTARINDENVEREFAEYLSALFVHCSPAWSSRSALQEQVLSSVVIGRTYSMLPRQY